LGGPLDCTGAVQGVLQFLRGKLKRADLDVVDSIERGDARASDSDKVAIGIEFAPSQNQNYGFTGL